MTKQLEIIAKIARDWTQDESLTSDGRRDAERILRLLGELDVHPEPPAWQIEARETDEAPWTIIGKTPDEALVRGYYRNQVERLRPGSGQLRLRRPDRSVECQHWAPKL
jgi:hypothetical protein